jgi:hypothetical protein
MSCCTINWMDQWPDDALNFVALRFLGDTEFRFIETRLKSSSRQVI